mgnify:CR=1 FL=1
MTLHPMWEKFPELQQDLQQTVKLMENILHIKNKKVEALEEAGEQIGLMIAYGTGGTVGANFDGLKEMFYHPDGYNVLPIPNIWDENATD